MSPPSTMVLGQPAEGERQPGPASPAHSTGSFDPLFDEGPSSSSSSPGFDSAGKSKTASSVEAALLPSRIYHTSLLPPTSNMASIPLYTESTLPPLGKGEGEVFMSSAIDGQVLLWDRRLKAGEPGSVRSLDSVEAGSGVERGRNWAACVSFYLLGVSSS
jgi:hypothetical protein